MAEKPIFRTAEEAWAELDGDGSLTADDGIALKAVFFAGMSSALSIGYHYGFAGLLAELKAANALWEKSDG